MPDPDALAEQLLAELALHPAAYLVGVAGIPGSGKTSLCEALARRRPDAAILSMDGYHLPRSRLDADQLRRRGALDTFDGALFLADLTALRQTRRGVFPGFDHAEKDPRPAAAQVTPDIPLVIVEGIYVLMQAWRAEPLFDLRVFVDCSLDEAVRRLARRHLATGITSSLAEGLRRATEIDRANAETILADGCRERADLILKTIPAAEA
ncbi:MAG TPA: hypothetical protein VFE24_16400 [Pirellulales bacterium]|nr:hypothetical protein [Pirellulales bacterium]